MTNKTQAVIIIVSMALAIAGVIVFARYKGSGSGAEVDFLSVWGLESKEALLPVFDMYTEQTEIQISYSKKNEATLSEEFTNALARGTGPDLIIAGADWIEKNKDILAYVDTKAFSAREYEDTFADIASETFIDGEKILAFPLWIDPLVLYWNRDIFNANSIASAPENWTQVMEASNTIKNIGSGGRVSRAGIALGRAKNIPLFKEIISLMLLQQRADIEDSQGNFIFGGPRLGSGESVLRFYTDFGIQSASEHSLYTWSPSSRKPRDLFSEGGLAMMIDFASYFPALRERNPHTSFSIAAAPQLENTDIPADFANVAGIAVSHMSTKQNPAWSFGWWLAGEEPGRMLLKNHTVAPARRNLIDDPAFTENPHYKLLRAASLIAKRTHEAHPQENSVLISSMVESVADGRLTVSEALNEALRKSKGSQ